MDGGQFEQISYCHCGILADLRISWSNLNPGKRFLGCKSYGSSFACHFFNWYDPPMNNHVRVVLVGLLKRVKVVESQRKNERIV